MWHVTNKQTEVTFASADLMWRGRCPPHPLPLAQESAPSMDPPALMDGNTGKCPLLPRGQDSKTPFDCCSINSHRDKLRLCTHTTALITLIMAKRSIVTGRKIIAVEPTIIVESTPSSTASSPGPEMVRCAVIIVVCCRIPVERNVHCISLVVRIRLLAIIGRGEATRGPRSAPIHRTGNTFRMKRGKLKMAVCLFTSQSAVLCLFLVQFLIPVYVILFKYNLLYCHGLFPMR